MIATKLYSQTQLYLH